MQGPPVTIDDVFTTRPTSLRPAWVDDRAFARRRAIALKRLTRLGMPEPKAEAWIHAWDETTADLVDFRRAPDFWQLGFEYALEEYRLGFDPPVFAVGSQPRADVGVAEERARTG